MTKYYFLEGENRRGPFSKEELLTLDNINADTLIWSEKFDGWTRFGDVFSEHAPPPPPASVTGAKSKKYSRKLVVGALLTILLLSVATLLFFNYRQSLIHDSLAQLMLTGNFDDQKLEKAASLGSDYAKALLGLSLYDVDSIRAVDIYRNLSDSDDWMVIALRNKFLKETAQVDLIKTSLENQIAEDDWFWIHMKAVFIINRENGFQYDKEAFLALEKRAADLGSVSAMKNYALNSSDVQEQCTYLDKVINSDYSKKDQLAKVYFQRASISIADNRFKIPDSLFFKYAAKSAEFGSAGGYYLLGLAFEKGIGTDISPNSAFAYWFRAVELGYDASYFPYGTGSYILAQCYKNGFGVEANYESYKEKLEVAVNYGYEKAVNEKKELEQQALQRQTVYSGGSTSRLCDCCGTAFNPIYGWGYSSSSGPYRENSTANSAANITNNMYANLFASIGLQTTPIGPTIKYCRKQCAWDCQ